MFKKIKRIKYLKEKIRLMSLDKKIIINNYIITIIFQSISFENKKIEESKELISKFT